MNPSDPGLTVSVVMPTYKRRDRLAEAVRPLLGSGALEVVVVVDGVDDGSLELLEDLRRTQPRLRPVWRENGGEGAARQTGLEHACGDVVLFLDDDVLAGPGLAEGHARAHALHERSVVLGYMPTPTPDPRRPGQFATFLYSAEYERSCRRWESGESDVLATLWAGNMSMRREEALRVGMQGPDFSGLYHADQDLGLRCAAAGLRGVFERGLVAQHVHERPLPAFIRDARAQGAGRVRLAAAHPGRLELPSDEDFLRGLPPLLTRATASEAALSATCLGLTTAVRVLGRLHAFPLETRAAQLLRRLEQVRGARGERATRFPAPIGPDR